MKMDMLEYERIKNGLQVKINEAKNVVDRIILLEKKMHQLAQESRPANFESADTERDRLKEKIGRLEKQYKEMPEEARMVDVDSSEIHDIHLEVDEGARKTEVDIEERVGPIKKN